MANKTIKLTVRNREKMVFEEEVKAISSINKRGVFDILPDHANFISLIKEYLVVHKADGAKHEIKIDNGILRVHENEIKIYIGLNSGAISSSLKKPQEELGKNN